jgi:hypothetical protein
MKTTPGPFAEPAWKYRTVLQRMQAAIGSSPEGSNHIKPYTSIINLGGVEVI